MIKVYFGHDIDRIKNCPYTFNFKKEKGFFFNKEVFLDEDKIFAENNIWIWAKYDAVLEVNKNNE